MANTGVPDSSRVATSAVFPRDVGCARSRAKRESRPSAGDETERSPGRSAAASLPARAARGTVLSLGDVFQRASAERGQTETAGRGAGELGPLTTPGRPGSGGSTRASPGGPGKEAPFRTLTCVEGDPLRKSFSL